MDNDSGNKMTRDEKVMVRWVMDAKRNATTDRDRYLSVCNMLSPSNTIRGITGTTYETGVLDMEGRNWTNPDDIFYDCETTIVDVVTEPAYLTWRVATGPNRTTFSMIAIQVTLLT